MPYCEKVKDLGEPAHPPLILVPCTPTSEWAKAIESRLTEEACRCSRCLITAVLASAPAVPGNLPVTP